MDAGDGRKRLRDGSEPRITYHATNRTFDRLFKEESLDETKEVVRRKLGLPATAVIQLAQLRGGQAIDLEDDDDFDAFYSVAHSSTSVDVRVTILPATLTQSSTNLQSTPLTNGHHNHISPSSPSRNHDISMSEAADATDVSTRKRKVAFVDASPATAQVVPPKKRRMSTSRSSIQSDTNHAPMSGGVTSSTQVSSTDSTESPESPSENLTAIGASSVSEKTNSAQNDPVAANHASPAHSDDALTPTEHNARKRKAAEAVKDNSESASVAQSSKVQMPQADQQGHDDRSRKKKKKKKEGAGLSDSTSGHPISTSGEVEPSAEMINPKSDLKNGKKKKSQTSVASTGRFTEQLAEMITNSTKPAESQPPKDSNGDKATEDALSGKRRKSKVHADGESGVDVRSSDSKVKSNTASSKKRAALDSSINEKFTGLMESPAVEKSLEVESSEGKTKRKKKKKTSGTKTPTSAAELAAAAETLKALSMRIFPRSSGSATPSGPTEDETPLGNTATTLERESTTLEATDNQISPHTIATKEAQRVSEKDNASVTNVKSATSMSMPSIPSQDKPSHAGPTVNSLYSDDSSDDNANLVIKNAPSSRKQLDMPFSGVDLEALIRGPRRKRLTLDEALSTELHSLPKETHEVVLEEEEVIKTKHRRPSIAMAIPSDSERDIASDSTSDDLQLTPPRDLPKGSVESLLNLPEPDSHSSNDVVTPEVPDEATSQGSKPESVTSATEDYDIDVPPPVLDEVLPSSPIDDQDPIEPVAIPSRTASPIEDAIPTSDTPQVARRAGLRPRGNEKPPLKARTQPPTRKSAKMDNTQSDLIAGLRESGVKMTRSRSKQIASASQPSHTDDPPPSSTSRQSSFSTEKVSEIHSAIAPSQRPVEGARLGSSDAVFDAPLGEWAVLKGSSPTVDAETDELHSTADQEEPNCAPKVLESAQNNAKNSLFVGSSSQEEFPYSQWQDLDEMGPSPSEPPRVASPAADDSEDENEVEASIMSQDVRRISSYRRLTDIASQRSLFNTPVIPQPSGKSDPASTTRGMYGAVGKAYDDDTSDSDDDSDGVEMSHIPKSRRAGSRKTS